MTPALRFFSVLGRGYRPWSARSPAFSGVFSASPRLVWLLVGLAGHGLAGCGSEASPEVRASAKAAASDSAGDASGEANTFYVPLRDPELAPVRAALEGGHGDLARTLLERVSGFEAQCLRARAELLRGDAVAALAALERARALDDRHAELASTEIEVLSALDRLNTASEQLAEAFRRKGPHPALLRAQGVFELRRSGHARAALEALERARARDPELPFLSWPLAQAHLLVGRALVESAPAEATAHARAARRLRPEAGGLRDEALELEAEGLAGELRFEEAIALYEELAAGGRSFGDTPAILHQRCATRCLLEHDRARAVEHYLAARRLGLADSGLGFGSEILVEEARAALERGSLAAERADWPQAGREFARALELAPEDLEAENHLGVARFQEQDYRGAAMAWERVLLRAERRERTLPDPVALNLAKAWRLAGEPARARGVLSELLDRDPEGQWSEGARELLLVLEAEALAGG